MIYLPILGEGIFVQRKLDITNLPIQTTNSCLPILSALIPNGEGTKGSYKQVSTCDVWGRVLYYCHYRPFGQSFDMEGFSTSPRLSIICCEIM